MNIEHWTTDENIRSWGCTNTITKAKNFTHSHVQDEDAARHHKIYKSIHLKFILWTGTVFRSWICFAIDSLKKTNYVMHHFKQMRLVSQNNILGCKYLKRERKQSSLLKYFDVLAGVAKDLIWNGGRQQQQQNCVALMVNHQQVTWTSELKCVLTTFWLWIMATESWKAQNLSQGFNVLHVASTLVMLVPLSCCLAQNYVGLGTAT